MHLIQPANTLTAEIELAAAATIRRDGTGRDHRRSGADSLLAVRRARAQQRSLHRRAGQRARAPAGGHHAEQPDRPVLRDVQPDRRGSAGHGRDGDREGSGNSCAAAMITSCARSSKCRRSAASWSATSRLTAPGRVRRADHRFRDDQAGRAGRPHRREHGHSVQGCRGAAPAMCPRRRSDHGGVQAAGRSGAVAAARRPPRLPAVTGLPWTRTRASAARAAAGLAAARLEIEVPRPRRRRRRCCRIRSFRASKLKARNVTGKLLAYASPDSTFAVTKRLLDSAQESIVIGIYDFHADHMKATLKTAMQRGVYGVADARYQLGGRSRACSRS